MRRHQSEKSTHTDRQDKDKTHFPYRQTRLCYIYKACEPLPNVKLGTIFDAFDHSEQVVKSGNKKTGPFMPILVQDEVFVNANYLN